MQTTVQEVLRLEKNTELRDRVSFFATFSALSWIEWYSLFLDVSTVELSDFAAASSPGIALSWSFCGPPYCSVCTRGIGQENLLRMRETMALFNAQFVAQPQVLCILPKYKSQSYT